jgi:hypothetical protein
MDTITTVLRRNLFDRPPQPDSTSPEQRPSSAEDKFMQHFETINKVSMRQAPVPFDSHEEQFAQTLIEYSSKISEIDKILMMPEDAGLLGQVP